MTQDSAGRRTLRRNIRELSPHAWILIGGSFINRFGSFVVPFLVLYLRQRHFSIARSGTALAAYGAGELIASPVGGYLADRIGRRWTIALSMYASAAAMIALWRVDTYGPILGLAFVAGLVSEARRPASLALLTDLVPTDQRVTVFAVLRLAENLAFAAGVALGGFLANTSFAWLFVGDALSSAVYGSVALLALPEGTRSSRAEERRRGEGWRAALADRSFVLFMAASVLLFFVYFQQQSTLPIYVRANGLTNADFGLLLSLNGVIVLLFELPISAITMRHAKKPTIALGFLLVGLGFGLTGFAHGFAALAAIVSVWTLGEMIAAPVSYAYVADLAPEHLRGRYQGLYGLCFGIAAIAGPAGGTILYANGARGFWALCGALGLLAALVALGTRERAGHGRHRMGAVRPLGPSDWTVG